MATDATRIGSGTLSTTLADIDTAATSTGTLRIVKAVTLCNKSTTACSVSMNFASVPVLSAYSIPAVGGENTITIPFMDQVMNATERIQGFGTASSAVAYYISGRGVTL